MRPPVRAGWSLRGVCVKTQREAERKALQEEGKAGEAGGAPPSPAFWRHTYAHVRGEGGWGGGSGAQREMLNALFYGLFV